MISISVITGLIAMLGWGTGDFIQSKIVREIGEYKTMFALQILFLIEIIPFIFLAGIFDITLNNFLLVLIGSVVNIFAFLQFLRSLKIGDIAVVTPISATYPFLTIFLLWTVLGQNIGFLVLIGILTILSGLILTSVKIRELKKIKTVKGMKESILTLLAWGIYYFILEIISGEYVLGGISFESTNYLAVFFFTSLINFFVVAGFTILKRGVIKRKDLNRNNIILLVIVSLIFTFTWLAIQYGIQNGKTAIVTTVASLYPAITVLLGVMIYKEKISLNQKLGIFVILAGLVLISI